MSQKKSFWGLVALLLAAFIPCEAAPKAVQTDATGIVLNNTPYTLDTLANYQVGPGSTYFSVRMYKTAGGGRLDAFLLRVDLQNPYIHLEEMLGKDKLVGVERPSSLASRKTTGTHRVVGGSNGDFFVTQGDVGMPVGLTVQNGEYGYIGSSSRRLGAVTADGKAVLGTNWAYAGWLIQGQDSLRIDHINYSRGADQLVLFNQYNGATTGTNQYGTEVLVALAEGETWKTNGTMRLVVQSKESGKGSMSIPAGQAVLSGHGAMEAPLQALSAGDEVTVAFTMTIDGLEHNLQQCVGGDNYALILHDGVAEQSNFWNELHPRTGFGATVTGDTVLFCVVDGRGASVGCTTKVLGEIMQHFGAYNAVNWDGGGSSCLYLNRFGQVNDGSDGSERATGNSMFAVADVPTEDNTITQIHPYEYTVRLPRYAVYQPHFLGYNQYGILLNEDVAQVALSCEESLGTILADGSVQLTGTQDGILTATYGEATTQIQIRLASDAQIAFRLDSVLLDNRSNYEVEVYSTVGQNTVSIPASSVQWTSADEAVCEVNERGEVSAKQNGRTYVYGALGEFEDSLLVVVENAETPTLLADGFTTPEAWNLTSIASFNAHWKDASTIEFDYAITRKPFVMIAQDLRLYGLPDSVRVSFVTDANFESLAWTMTAAKAPSKLLVYTEEINGATSKTITLPLSNWLGDFDRALYPVMSKTLRFNLSTATTAGLRFLTLQEITLCYQGIEITALNNTMQSGVGIYPNPLVNNQLYTVGVSVGSEANLYDVQGHCVWQGTVGADGALNLGALTAGTYVLQMEGREFKLLKH